MENEQDKDIRLSDEMRAGLFQTCKQHLINQGFPEEHADIVCGEFLKRDEMETEDDLGERNTKFNLMFVDTEDSKKEKNTFISAKIKILKKEHPDWSHEQIVAVAHSYWRKRKKDAVIPLTKKVGGESPSTAYYGIERVGNISLKKISSVIKLIKTKRGMKVGHMGLPPFLSMLPMKSLNRLQTKLEKLFTEEQKYLTAEQQSQRATYMTTMKKQDALEIAEIIGEENMKYLTPDTGFFYDELSIENANTALNNIIKAPIILAKEITQPYWFKNENGSTRKEIHFKPYAELERSIEALEQLPIIIEHQDNFTEDEIVGYVKQLVADPEIRGIRGTGYFFENKIPKLLFDKLKNKEPVGVSIGFLAELGNSGLFDGIFYDHSQQNIELEHLAVIFDSIPRCPIESCGINIEENKKDYDEFTIINKGNYYYNIDSLLKDTRKQKINSEKNTSSDSMTDDSFADPKSGKISSGTEPKDLETMLDRLRRYMAGVSDLVEQDFAKKKIQEILHMTDDKGEDEEPTQEGEDNMDEKEFEDAIAKKDQEIASLKEIIKDSLIKEIKQFADAETLEKLSLDDKCVHDLKTIKDTITTFKPIEKEADVLPMESKDEKGEAMKEAGLDKKEKKYDTSELNTKINEEFDMSGFTISG